MVFSILKIFGEHFKYGVLRGVLEVCCINVRQFRQDQWQGAACYKHQWAFHLHFTLASIYMAMCCDGAADEMFYCVLFKDFIVYKQGIGAEPQNKK